MLGLTSVALLVVTAAPLSLQPLPPGVSQSPAECSAGANVSLRIAATTDVHGHIRGWDYYDNRVDPLRGLARAATIVDSVRSVNPGRVLLVDAGDMLQGTPLTYVAARISKSRINPVVAAMNAMHHDAATIGNHEFNYGVPYLDSAAAQARFPMLAANVTRGGNPRGYPAIAIVHRDGVSVGIVGATTPGSNLWDASNLKRAGVHVGDIVPAVRAAVVEARRRGADVIVVVLETLAYVNSTIGTTPDAWRSDAWRSDSARLAPTALTGLIMEVERRAAHADIASTAAFDLNAHLGPGPITVAQLAQLYPYENTLRAIRITGAQLKAYLEYSNRYYETSATGALIPDTSVAGYNFDVVSGVHYTVDVTKPVGQRVLTLTFHGRSVAPTDTFIMALNNYRQSGGGGYAMLRDAPVVYDRQQDIRQLLIEEVQRLHEIHEVDYRANNWSFVKPSTAR